MERKKQKLMAVRVAAAGGAAGAAAIVPIDGGTLEELLAAWRVVQIQPLGPMPDEGGGEGGVYLALLLLEETAAEDSLGRLGFGAP